ncbi:response regulator, partial [uncultured Oscillibacter sp.]|uniref:response regulator n=1 Tax=uncultured Oscillibacter sp. TaxID=876091 RepID=UPI0026017664
MDHSFLHSKKRLLADDEPELLKMVSAILADEGFQRLVTAANMKEGISAAKAGKPDLAILDVCLPDGDGFTLMEQIRTWTDIPVIFLTA